MNTNINTQIYNPTDARGIAKITMRDKFKQNGKDFKVWGDQAVIKLSKSKFEEIVKSSIQVAWDNHTHGDECDLRTLQYTPYSIEYSASHPYNGGKVNETLDSHDLFRVQIEQNYDDDGYDYEPDSPDAATQEILLAHMDVYGVPQLVDSFVKTFKAEIKDAQDKEKSSLVNWIFVDGSGANEKTFHIKKTWEMDRVYYPWIKSSLETYYRSFMESRAQILVLYGPPGTGKTSFIRDLICEMNLNSYISYDLKILTSDSTFVNYVTGSIFDAIVIEDADDLLTADRDEQNKVIAKILNVSDGLIKLPRKKLIFSTNLSNVADIDQAIIRPGRCFDVMEFRELNRDEALDAANHLGVKLTEDKDKYSLADIFFLKDMQDSTDPLTLKHGDGIKKTKMGFV